MVINRALGGLAICFFAHLAPAQAMEGKASEPPRGLLPVPDYTGDISSRSHLSGDWGGTRSDLANKGVQFEFNWTQTIQAVVDGGQETGTEYGGNLDYLIRLDLMRMGVLPGALITIRAETRYGNSVNRISGPILPVNSDAFFPLTDEPDKGVAITITDLNYTQFLSEHLGVFAGKISTLDGDLNEFASGRGTSQFMNANFLFNAATALRVPYSTLGAGVLWLPARNISVKGVLMNTVDSSTTSGFEDFGDGMTASTEADLQYRLGQLPGGINIGGLYSYDQDFTQVSGDLIFQPGVGFSVPTKSDTWAIFCSGWQYLIVEDPTDKPIDLMNGTPDHRGIGLFARAGIADDDTNPVAWSLSGGIGGRGMIPSRDRDTFGVGYYFTKLQDSRFIDAAGVRGEVQGAEAFYNVAITPAAHLTFDVQIVDSPSENVDPAVVLGARLSLSF